MSSSAKERKLQRKRKIQKECEVAPLLKLVLHSVHVVHLDDAVAAEGVVDGVVQPNGEGDAVQ